MPRANKTIKTPNVEKRRVGVPARQRLLAAAADAFYEHGINGTGIDAIIASAGVAKMSLYNNFASKDELVLAYLDMRHEEWLDLYWARVSEARSPIERVTAVFDAYLDHAEMSYQHGFRGCGILNAAAELPAGAPGRAAVRKHKEEVESLLADHVGEFASLSKHEVKAIAEHLSFVLEGAMARAGLEGDSRRLLHARSLAMSLLKSIETN